MPLWRRQKMTKALVWLLKDIYEKNKITFLAYHNFKMIWSILAETKTER